MNKVLQLFRPADADGKGADAPAKAEHMLGEAELDHVTGGGGKAGASTNPVGD